LGDIVAALVADLKSANARADLARAEMARAYARSPLLAGTEPCQMQVVTATVSLPVALEDLADVAPADLGLDEEQLETLLPREVGEGERRRLARRVLEALGPHNRLLSGTLEKAVRAALARFAPHLEERALADFEASVAALARREREAVVMQSSLRCLFRHQDLEQVGTDRLVRIELSISLA
jgi:hypothetical protein